MAWIDSMPGCCGMKVLSNLNEPPSKMLRSHRSSLLSTGLVAFSDRVSYNNGIKLAKFIQKHKLGDVVESMDGTNPIHGSTIRAWIWKPSKEGFEEWLKPMPKKVVVRKRSKAAKETKDVGA
jgi:hypothetical protein